MVDSEGRLELDDVGEPLDRRDDDRRDLVAWGDDGPTWAARLALRLRTHAGVVVGRHRVLTASIVGAVVLLVAAAALDHGRPPDEDLRPGISLIAVPGPTSALVDVDQYGRSGVFQASYLAVLTSAGDAFRVLGVTGPGLAGPSALPTSTITGEAPVVVFSTVDCTRPGWETSADRDYTVEVRRTDVYGRSRTFEVGIGPSATEWRGVVQQRCLASVLPRLRFAGWEAHASTRDHLIRLRVQVSSGWVRPLWLQFDQPGTASPQPAVELDPGATASLSADWDFGGCDLAPPSLPSDGPRDVLPILVGLEPLPPGLDRGPRHAQGLHIPDPLRAALNARLATACAASGSPA